VTHSFESLTEHTECIPLLGTARTAGAAEA